MSSIIEKEKLYTWNEGMTYKFVKKKGIPRNIETLVLETISPKFVGRWSSYYSALGKPPTGENSFPKQVYFEVPANNKIMFDFLGRSHHVKIVSERMLQFLKEQGLVENYELATVEIVNRRGRKIETEKQYFALRFYGFDDDLLEFNNKVKVSQISFQNLKPLTFDLFPNLKVKKSVEKKIFASNHPTFKDALVFTQEVRDLIAEKKFIGPNIYDMEELWQAFVDEKPVY